MSALLSLDLIVQDVVASAEMLRDAFGLAEEVIEPGFAQLSAGPVTIMLSRTAMVPMENAAGAILHLRVADPAQAAERAVAAGAEVLQPLTQTDWGTTSVLLRGPEATVIDLFSEPDGERVPG